MEIIDFPELRQIYNYDCGACAVSCVLAYCGLDIREEWIAKLAETTPDGTSMAGIVKVFNYFGLPTYVGEKRNIKQLCHAIDCGFPTIIALQAYRSVNVDWKDDWEDGHYVVAIGYNNSRIYFEDPSSYKRTWLSHEELMDRWHDIEGDKKIYQWGCTVQCKSNYHANDSVHMD